MMYLDDLGGTKFKRVCTDYLNLALLTKSAILGEILVTFAYISDENNYLG